MAREKSFKRAAACGWKKREPGLPHSISAGARDEALRLRSWDGWPPDQSWRVKLIVGDGAISDGGRLAGMRGVIRDLLGPVGIAVVLVGVPNYGRLRERRRRRRLSGGATGTNLAIFAE